jgi:Domain of unknown function (DUF397)
MAQLTRAAQKKLHWRVAQKCENGACIQVAPNGGTVIVGDSKHPDGPTLNYTRTAWRNFVREIKNGTFDNLI